MNWLLNGVEVTDEIMEGNMGFVYLITNTLTGRKYIGKKLFTFMKVTQVKLKKKRARVRSDWNTYYGSNSELKGDIATQGEQHFKREILHICKTKGECNYLEAKEIFVRGVLERSDFYNGWMSVRVAKSHIKNLQINEI